MHRFQSSVPASALPSNQYLHQQTLRLNTSGQPMPHNQYLNNYTPATTNPHDSVPNTIDQVTSAEQSSEELSDISSVALPDLLKAINPQMETDWKVGAPDAYQVLLSNHPKPSQQQMSAYLDQVVAANSTQRSSFPASHNQSAHPERVITQNSQVQQVTNPHTPLAFTAEQRSQTQRVASVPAMTRNNNPLAIQTSIAGNTTAVSPIPVQSTTLTPVDATARPIVQASVVCTSSMVSPANVPANPMVAGPVVRPNTSVAGAMRRPTSMVGHPMVAGSIMTGGLASHPVQSASQVASVASGPMPVGNMTGLHLQNGINSTNVVSQVPQAQGTVQAGLMPTMPTMPTNTHVRHAGHSTNMVVNRAAAAAAAAAASMSSAMQLNPVRLNQGGYVVPTTSAPAGRDTGKRKSNSLSKRSSSPRKAKVPDQLAVKPLKEEEFTMEVEPVNGSQGDENGSDEVETKKAMRAERNRQSAAASRERKKHYIKELEKRVGVLSKANAEIQMEQLKVLKQSIATERRHDLTVTFKNMEIAKLKNQVAELSPSPLAARTKLERNTWDSAAFAAQTAKFKNFE